MAGLDTVGTLFDASGQFLASDADGGEGANFRIRRRLAAGVAYVRVESFGNSAVGRYTLYARVIPGEPPPPSLGEPVIETLAGTGEFGDGGDNGPAAKAQLGSPEGVAVDAAGNVYVSDSFQSVRRIDRSGVISRFAGDGVGRSGSGGDGDIATEARFWDPDGIAVDAAGNVYVADSGNNRVRRIDPSGVITTFAGVGGSGIYISGDGGRAEEASIRSPTDVAVDAAGNVYVTEFDDKVRRIDTSGIITTFAGRNLLFSSSGFEGDGGPATEARLAYPRGVAADGRGNVYIADTNNHRVRKVDPAGTITTLAGTGTEGSGGDGGPAAKARLNDPEGVAADSRGNVYIADTNNHRVRRVNPAGTITTLAGTGMEGSGGDGRPAAEARLAYPRGVAVDGPGNVYIADTNNHRVRVVRLAATASRAAGDHGDEPSNATR